VNKRVLALLAALIAAAVCFPAASVIAAEAEVVSNAVPSPVIAAPVTAAEVNYRIVEEDTLRLDVWGEQQLSNMQMQVTPGGMISVPYLGDMKVAGLTQTEVAQMIVKKLADLEILADAKVQITLITLHRPQARVLGAVQRPGSFEFKDGDTVLDAIAQGGSYSEDALLESASLTHKGSKESIPLDLKKMLAGDLSQNYPLQNGDAIYIPHEDYKNKIYVLGQVNRPGQYSLKEKTTLLAAISLAGGQTERGNIRKAVIIRGDPAKPERVQVNLRKLFDTGDLAQDAVLRSGDIVVVPETKSPNWNKISQVISTILNASYLGRLAGF